jgi:tRNA-splicing ligase RtcB
MYRALENLSVRRLDKYRLEIRRQPPMLTCGVIYANARIEKDLKDGNVLRQVANVACLSGIIGPSLAMPDIHWGYGFPIGGVAAFSLAGGIIAREEWATISLRHPLHYHPNLDA